MDRASAAGRRLVTAFDLVKTAAVSLATETCTRFQLEEDYWVRMSATLDVGRETTLFL